MHAYPNLDSVVWQAAAGAPALERVLAFDDEGGAIAALDAKGAPVRIDLRLGGVARQATPALRKVGTADGRAIYGVTAKGAIARLTPGGGEPWTHAPKLAVRDLLPQPNGSIVVASDSGGRTVVWVMHPPEERIARSTVLPETKRSLRTPAGDRVYFTAGDALIGVRTRDLQAAQPLELEAPARAVVTSPSGDRLYVIADSSRRLTVVDRYSEDIAAEVRLPGVPRDLRMDPTGRYLLIRAPGDSVWVLDVAGDRLTGSAASAWRSDLPAVTPDGAIALVQGDDVQLVAGATLAPRARIAGGAKDLWFFFTWDGFRPRLATGVTEDLPPPAPMPDESENPFAGQVALADSLDAGSDTATHAESGAVVAPAAPPAPAAREPEFTLQFAALREEASAREMVREIREARAGPRVMATVRVMSSRVGESMVYRVIAGPFRTREEAEQSGQRAGKPFWVYEGAP